MTYPTHRRHWLALCGTSLFAVAALMPMLANAASLEIDPVRLNLSHKQPTAALTIRNNSDQPAKLEIKTMAWTQVDAKDVNTVTKELLVSPPIVTIAPHGSQIVRAALRRQADPKNELAYRIHIQELPAAPLPGLTGVQVALHISLPVFVSARNGKSAPHMVWSAVRKTDGQLMLTLHNQGTAHIQVADFSLLSPGTNELVAQGPGASYVLAGQTQTWDLVPLAADKMTLARLRLKVSTDAGDADQELPLDKP